MELFYGYQLEPAAVLDLTDRAITDKLETSRSEIVSAWPTALKRVNFRFQQLTDAAFFQLAGER
jgi:hypothetical protein